MHNMRTSGIPGQRDILCRQTSTCWRMYQVLVWWVSCWLASNQHHTSLADCKSRLLPSKIKQNHTPNIKPIAPFSWAKIIVFLTMVVVHAFRRQKTVLAMQTSIPRTLEYIVIMLFLRVIGHEQVALAVCCLQHYDRRRNHYSSGRVHPWHCLQGCNKDPNLWFERFLPLTACMYCEQEKF